MFVSTSEVQIPAQRKMDLPPRASAPEYASTTSQMDCLELIILLLMVLGDVAL